MLTVPTEVRQWRKPAPSTPWQKLTVLKQQLNIYINYGQNRKKTDFLIRI
ncbi:MAG: hypothetical protein IGQ45_07905 [Cyanobacterium sp. T60_A2020_053]|nr:hypothetical protein [Cyanobacterium sp. T60_A2020_053]